MTTIKVGDASYGFDTLLGCALFLNSHGVRFVNLKWTWSCEIELAVPSEWPFTDGGEFRARYIGNKIDCEYSYIGVFDFEAFSEFAQSYSCWDGEDLSIVDGVLVGTVNEWDPDAKEFPDRDEEISIIKWEDIGLAYYEYWDEAAKKWRVMP